VIWWLKQTRWILIGIVLAGLVTDARALDPNRLPSQYVREQWTTATRFPGGAVNGIAQTADGYLWIGTDRGLIRFDGFTFRPVSFASIATASNVPILQLLTDAAGKLWVRPQGADLMRQKDGGFESVRYGPVAITALLKDNHDGVLVSDIAQGTFRFTEDHVQKLGPASPPVISLAETADGNIWMGTLGDGLFLLRDGRATRVNAGLPDRKINCLLAIGGDELWVGTDTGLYRGNGSGFRRLELPSFLGIVQVSSLLRDRDSNIWVGTTRGLLRINEKGISFSEENELRGDGGINVLFEDREGNLWIGGARGLGRIRDSAFVTYSSVSDRRFEHTGPVYVDPEGRTWLAPAQGGLYVLQDGHVQPVPSIPANEVVYSISGGADEVWAGRQRRGLTRLQFRDGAIGSQSYTEANGLAQNSAYAVYESRDGSVWAGTLNGGVSKFKDGRFTTYTTTNGLASNTISAILETRDGGMWFATPNGLSSFSNGQWRTYTTAEGLPSSEVNCLFEDSSGTLWSGTTAGLAFFASNHFQVPHELPDILREQIVGMAEDKSGRFWIATSNHVLRVPRDKLLNGVVKEADVREYGQADGLESTEGVKRSRSVVSDSGGRIWFSLSSGLSVVNPSQIADNSAPALPHIEAITADNTTAKLAASVRIPPSPGRITFEYTGLSLAAPGRIRFRYFLEGFDSSWSQPVAAREAVYTNLGPGSYRFRLVASNSEGLWNGPETAIALNVAPAYYQTYWFRLSSIAIFIALLWALYRWRVHRLRSEEKRLRDVVETIPTMTFTTLSNGSCTFVNKRWTEYTGLSVEETSGAGWQRAVHPEDLVRHTEKWRTSVASGEVFEDEARFHRAADGEYRWFLVRSVPLRDQHGNVVRWYGTLTDIEDRRRAGEALQLMSEDLQDSKVKLEEAQRITHVGYWEWDILTGRLNWSDETYRIYGLRPQERPMDIASCQEMIDPEDWQRGLEGAVGGARFNAECRLFRPTGEVRIAHFQGEVKRDASGRPYRMFGSIQDITDRKRAEETLESMSRDLQESKNRLEEAQRIAHVGHWVWDLEKDGLTWSDETYRIFGLRPQERPMNVEAFQEMIHPEDRELLLRATQAARGGEHPDIESRIVRPSGEVRIVHIQGALTRDVPGQPRQRFGTVQDITERKRAEEALQKSQFYLDEGQRVAHMGSWAFNPSGFFEYWSRELFQIYGLDPQKGAPTSEEYLATVHPADRDFMAELIKGLREQGCGFDVRKRIIRPDGAVRYIRCVGIPVLEKGVLKGFLGTGMDVTEQEQLTQELKRREAYLAEAQILSRTGSFGWKPNTGEIAWSDESYRIFEYNPAEKLTLDRIMERVHPEDRHLTLEVVEQASNSGGIVDFKLRLLFPEGRVKYLRVLVRPLGIAHDDLEFAGAVVDRTEAHLAEERIRQDEAELRLLIDAIPQQVAVFGPDWNALFTNRQAQEYAGLSRQEVQSIAAIDGRIHPDDLGRLHGNRERATRERTPVETEARIRGKEGIYRWFLLRAYPLQDSQGSILRWYATRTDITDLKNAEQERERLRQLEAALAHTNRVSTLGEMAASLAHEIKQPIAAAITSANSCIEWLAHEPPNLDRARAAAARIDKYGNRAAEIIDRIRSFYKKSPPQRELVDVNGIIHELLTLLESEATRSSVAMRTELAAELPKIMADRVQLQQVFMNLMLNGIEAMEDSGGELTVKSELQAGQLQFSVSDTGVGLPLEKMDQIFSAFYTNKPQGSGMGLTISRSIVESHGGQLWASTNGGRGATFHFTLPTHVTEAALVV
jgi:PAS domain S-box-containing protein